MNIFFRNFSGRRTQGAVAIEMAIVLPVLILLLTTLVFFARVFWYYSVLQKAAHDATRFLSTATQVEMRTVGAPAAVVARAIAEAEIAQLVPDVEAIYIEMHCNSISCGSALVVPSTVRTQVHMQMRDTLFAPITAEFYGDDGFILTADVTMRYAGN